MVKQIICRKKKKARKLKEGMRKILRNLKRIQEYEKRGNKISEIDTQTLLVEPVLCLAGYDIYNPFIVKRASRNARHIFGSGEFDIEVYKNGNLFLAIEVKSFSSEEFNINKINNEIGKLEQRNGKWSNKANDGVGQLRAYCLNWNKLNRCTIPILTNGKEWILFNLSRFIDPNTVSQSINESMILCHAKITDDDFYDTIVKRLKNT